MSDHSEHTPEEEQAARLTAFVLGELSEEEQTQVESELSESVREECDELERLAVAALKADRAESLPKPSATLVEAVESKLANDAATVELNKSAPAGNMRGQSWAAWATGLSLLLVVIAVPSLLRYNLVRSPSSKVRIAQLRQQNADLRAGAQRMGEELARVQAPRSIVVTDLQHEGEEARDFGLMVENGLVTTKVTPEGVEHARQEVRVAPGERDLKFGAMLVASDSERAKAAYKEAAPTSEKTSEALAQSYVAGQQLPSTTVAHPTTAPGTTPNYTTPSPSQLSKTSERKQVARGLSVVEGVPPSNQLASGPNARGGRAAVVTWGDTVPPPTTWSEPIPPMRGRRAKELHELAELQYRVDWFSTVAEGEGNEQYSQIVENRFVAVSDEPLSTFSIDVDTASYANARRFLTQNQMPPINAIRIEEFINYFSYDYPAPQEGEPFSVNLEVAECPWQPAHQLVRIGLKGKEIPQKDRPASNVVFLLDVSGSMQDANKLPLLKQAMKLLTDQLTESDRVSIVTYAGNAGLALDTTNGESKQTIRDSIDALNANGSTNGNAGIQLAYEKATESFIKDGANRVILATDGDLNVGVTGDDALVELIKEKAGSGVFLTVLGFGEGNLQDGKLEKLADHGNGMYAYVDSLREARKVLVEQIAGSLVTIAKDVKIKVEFNPAEVSGYRLLGYENRLMAAPDFDNDAKDAGEIGAGHTVTALYEIAPTKIPEQLASTAPSLKYQQTVRSAEPPKELTAAAETGELLTVFLRYKQPDANESTLSEFTVENKQRAFDDASMDFRFASAVASFGMVLRNSEFRGDATLAGVEEVASSSIGSDPQGHRTEFLDLVRKASALQPQQR